MVIGIAGSTAVTPYVASSQPRHLASPFQCHLYGLNSSERACGLTLHHQQRSTRARANACVSASNAAGTDTIGAAVRSLTPHSGYHYDGRNSRFFEGWYFRVALPGTGKGFAWMYSIEDPKGDSSTAGVGAQVMGPDDSYMVQFSRDTSSFWADPNSLALGACFEGVTGRMPPRVPVTEGQFRSAVQEGFQASLTEHHGSLRRQEEGTGGSRPQSTLESCRWSISVDPQYGWGPPSGKQQSTAGWLAALPVFEPHWQVCFQGCQLAAVCAVHNLPL